MNKIALGLIALATLSTASFAANNRSWDLRDTEYYTSSGVPTESATSNYGASADEAPLAFEGQSGNSAYERMMLRSEQRDHGDR